jgi:hypothetical protein
MLKNNLQKQILNKQLDDIEFEDYIGDIKGIPHSSGMFGEDVHDIMERQLRLK